MLEKKIREQLLDIENVLPIISKISIFAGLSQAQLYKLFRLLSRITYKTNELVFEQGGEPNYIYIVKKGKVKLVTWDGEIPYELYVFEEGNCFGESSVIGIHRHEGTAFAITDTELIVLSKEALLSIYDSDKEMFSILILNIAREIARRLHSSNDVMLHYMLEKKK